MTRGSSPGARLFAAPRVLAVEGFTPTLGATPLLARVGLPALAQDDARICFAVALDDPTAPLGLPVRRLEAGAPLPRSDAAHWADHAILQPGLATHPCDWHLTLRRDALRRAAERDPDGFAGGLARALAGFERRTSRWSVRGREIELRRDRPQVMAVVNVTPDSFSDGGRFVDRDAAVAQGEALAAAGAALLDVGGESTRPGSRPVPMEVELDRVVPVIEALARRVDRPISVDTTKAAVARAALDAGAVIVNDTSGLAADPEQEPLAPLIAKSGAGLVLMHRLAAPRTMQDEPRYERCASEVALHLAERVAGARAAGVKDAQIVLDPGIGFGKRLVDNLDLLAAVGSLRSLGFPVLLGASRKSFLGALTGRPVEAREAATLAATAAAFCAGAELVRVHDAAGSADTIRVLAALAGVDA